MFSQPPRRRKKRFPEAELLARLRFYEKILKENGVNIDDLNDQIDGLAIRDETKSSSNRRPESSDNATGALEASGKLFVSGKNGNGIYLNK